jgi:hypothetical protein
MRGYLQEAQLARAVLYAALRAPICYTNGCCRKGFVGLLLPLLLLFGCAKAVVVPEKTSIPGSVEIAEGLKSQMQASPQYSQAGDTASSHPDTINLTEMAELHNTTQIEVCRLDCASYTPFLTISNAELIASLVGSLDTDLPLRPHTRCPDIYQLHFTLEDGQHEYLGYTCEMMTPAFLRGNQEFWHGQDVIAPDAFNELMLPLIAPQPLE